jgi:hypothetical protein
LGNLNLELQGKGKTIGEMISTVNAYKNQFPLLIDDLRLQTFIHFPNIKDHLQNNPDFILSSEKYLREINNVMKDFNIRFSDFKKIEDIVQYLSFPFKTDLDVKYIATKIAETFNIKRNIIELELIRLQSDIFLKARGSERDLWKYVCKEKYTNLKRCSEYIHSCFGSTYLCESAFSYLKLAKTKFRSRLTDSHTGNSLRLSLSGYTPIYEKLVKEMKTQTSH